VYKLLHIVYSRVSPPETWFPSLKPEGEREKHTICYTERASCASRAPRLRALLMLPTCVRGPRVRLACMLFVRVLRALLAAMSPMPIHAAGSGLCGADE
jgi:hypothetical protein